MASVCGESLERRRGHTAGVAGPEDGLGWTRLADESRDSDHVGAALHRCAVRHAMRRPRTLQHEGLVLMPDTDPDLAAFGTVAIMSVAADTVGSTYVTLVDAHEASRLQ